MSELIPVAVFPDDENYVHQPPSWKSDDFEWRETSDCEQCGYELHVHYAQPLASCGCGTQEWHQ